MPPTWSLPFAEDDAMAMGRRKLERQDELFVATSELARSPGHPF